MVVLWFAIKIGPNPDDQVFRKRGRSPPMPFEKVRREPSVWEPKRMKKLDMTWFFFKVTEGNSEGRVGERGESMIMWHSHGVCDKS